MALPVFTIQSFNQNLLQAAGSIFIQRVESVSLLRNIGGFGGITGGRSIPMEKKMNDLTKALLDELQVQAKAKYPTAIALVNVHIDFSDIGKTGDYMFLAGQLSATALVRKSPKLKSSVPDSVPMSNMAPMAPSTAPMAPMAPMAIGGKRYKKSKSRKRRH